MDKLLILVGIFVLMVACERADQVAVNADETLPPVTVERLADGVWVHTSYARIGKWVIPSNGLVVRDRTAGIVLIDTAWTDAQTKEVLDWVEVTLQAPVDVAVFTHAHNDKMGGVRMVRRSGIRTYAHSLSNHIAPSNDLVPAEFDIDLEKEEGWPLGSTIDVFYPGGGHTEDNIVVALPDLGIVFGGCLIRPGFSSSLGNTADAAMDEWARSVETVASRYPDADTVIPSHGPPGGRDLLSNTIRLAGGNAG